MKHHKRGSQRIWASGLYGCLFVAVAATTAIAVPVSAHAVTKRVEINCKRDYKRFCSKYSIGTTALRKCMEANGRRLSRKCFRALVDAGQVPRKYLRRRRR